MLSPGETLLDDWGGGGATYHGLLDHGGNTFLVFEDVSFGYFLPPDPAVGDLPESATMRPKSTRNSFISTTGEHLILI